MNISPQHRCGRQFVCPLLLWTQQKQPELTLESTGKCMAPKCSDISPYFYAEKEKLFPFSIFFLSRDLCDQDIEVMLTPEMIQVEFPILTHRDSKKEK